ncbi:hypothetical protein BD626DRAFT_569005 [Schizophyllum amplum]|uniref:Uncharacterized protein n=1 Tax=Schizophyllum amplum TaxID=97359 RepID=A0A550CFT5_9AGAR|nr:hypothetical protein BD626DRAFT_569005 [Auriculariopsis ampla]
MFSAINKSLNGPRRMLWTFSGVLLIAGGVMYVAKQSVEGRRKADLEAFRAEQAAKIREQRKRAAAANPQP